MLRHAAASSIIEYAYNDKAVLAQRLMLTEELYGNTFAVCKVRVQVCLLFREKAVAKELNSWSTRSSLNLAQVPGLEPEQEFIFQNQTQQHLRLRCNSLSCVYAAMFSLTDWTFLCC